MKKLFTIIAIFIMLFTACEETQETKSSEEKIIKTTLTINNQSDVDIADVNYASVRFYSGYVYTGVIASYDILEKGKSSVKNVSSGTSFIYFSMRINNTIINCRTEVVTCEEGKDTPFVFTNNTIVTYTGNNNTYMLRNLYTIFASFPGNLRAVSVTDNSINLAWNNVNGVNGYNIYRSTSQNGNYNKLNVYLLTENVFTDTTVTSGTVYWYAVSSELNELETVKTTAISAATLLSAPADVKVSSFTATGVSISWNTVTGAASYNVYRATAENGSYTKINSSSITVTNYSNSGLSANTQYYYYVCAVLSGIEGAKSSILSVKTLTVAPTGVTAVFQAPDSI